MEPKLNIKTWRIKRGLNQGQLAEKAFIHRGYISSIEAGKKLPTIEVLFKIAEALEVCPSELIKCRSLSCVDCSYKPKEV